MTGDADTAAPDGTFSKAVRRLEMMSGLSAHMRGFRAVSFMQRTPSMSAAPGSAANSQRGGMGSGRVALGSFGAGGAPSSALTMAAMDGAGGADTGTPHAVLPESVLEGDEEAALLQEEALRSRDTAKSAAREGGEVAGAAASEVAASVAPAGGVSTWASRSRGSLEHLRGPGTQPRVVGLLGVGGGILSFVRRPPLRAPSESHLTGKVSTGPGAGGAAGSPHAAVSGDQPRPRTPLRHTSPPRAGESDASPGAAAEAALRSGTSGSAGEEGGLSYTLRGRGPQLSSGALRSRSPPSGARVAASGSGAVGGGGGGAGGQPPQLPGLPAPQAQHAPPSQHSLQAVLLARRSQSESIGFAVNARAAQRAPPPSKAVRAPPGRGLPWAGLQSKGSGAASAAGTHRAAAAQEDAARGRPSPSPRVAASRVPTSLAMQPGAAYSASAARPPALYLPDERAQSPSSAGLPNPAAPVTVAVLASPVPALINATMAPLRSPGGWLGWTKRSLRAVRRLPDSFRGARPGMAASGELVFTASGERGDTVHGVSTGDSLDDEEEPRRSAVAMRARGGGGELMAFRPASSGSASPSQHSNSEVSYTTSLHSALLLHPSRRRRAADVAREKEAARELHTSPGTYGSELRSKWWGPGGGSAWSW